MPTCKVHCPDDPASSVIWIGAGVVAAVAAAVAAAYVAYEVLRAIIEAVLIGIAALVALSIVGAVIRLRWEHTHGLPLWQSRKRVSLALTELSAHQMAAIGQPDPVTAVILASDHERIPR